MESYDHNKKKSILKQRINFPEVKKPIIKAMRAQREFKALLVTKEMNIIYDFKQYAESRLKISESGRYISYEQENGQRYIIKIKFKLIYLYGTRDLTIQLFFIQFLKTVQNIEYSQNKQIIM